MYKIISKETGKEMIDCFLLPNGTVKQCNDNNIDVFDLKDYFDDYNIYHDLYVLDVTDRVIVIFE